MNGNDRNSKERERLADSLAAELAEAAYVVALRHEKPDSWIDLELDLWHAMGEAVRRWLPRDVDRRDAARREASREIRDGVQRRYASC